MSRSKNILHTRSGTPDGRIRTVLYSDGSGPPKGTGPGGYGAVITLDGRITGRVHGGAGRTTVNRMEMTAVIEGLVPPPLSPAGSHSV